MATRKKTTPKKARKASPSDANALSAELRQIINTELRKVTFDTHPRLFQRFQNPSGYMDTESQVISLCIVNGITPSSAIGQMEAALEE